MKNLINDIAVMIKRNLLRQVRTPRLIVFSLIQPVMFVLLFAYVFGGAIQTPGSDYINYLLPGIIVQTMLFGATQTGIGLADDLSKGLIDRYRSLPMARSAVLAGRTITEIIRNLVVAALMVGVGYIIGFRVEHGLGYFSLAIGLALLLGFAFSWISATIGLMVKDVETAQVAGFIWVFPLAFASSIFVPVETMRTGIRIFAEHNPISLVANTVRALTLGTSISSDAWVSLVWIAGILLVFVPLGVWRYRKIA